MRVILYTTPTCPYCTLARDFLRKRGVSFVEKDVSKDAEAAREMVEKSCQLGVPVIEVGDEVIVGFDAARLEKALAKLRRSPP